MSDGPKSDDISTLEDKHAVDELVADVRGDLKNSLRGVKMLLDGLDKADDPEEEGIPPVTDLAEVERLSRLRVVLQNTLADLP